MENRPIIDENGKEQWISRSIVVLCAVLRITDDKRIEVLVERRGPDVSATGMWCVPCGYLDYDETIKEGVIREVREETGYTIGKKDITFIDINSKPEGTKQNVVIRHIAFIDPNIRQEDGFTLDTGEVTELKWVEIGKFVDDPVTMFLLDYSRIKGVGKWAFGHRGIIINIIDKYCRQNGIELRIHNKD